MIPISEFAAAAVGDLLRVDTVDRPVFFGWDYASHVVDLVDRISTEVGLDADARECLRVAAWFHTTGVSNGGDRDRSYACDHAKVFMEGKGSDPDSIERVVVLIQSTALGARPSEPIEQVMSDAAWAYLASPLPRFLEGSLIRKADAKAYSGQDHSEVAWFGHEAKLIDDQRYLTAFGLREFEPERAENAKGLRRRIKTLKQEENALLEEALTLDHNELKKRLKKLAKIEGVPERGIETLFRLVSKNHHTLKRMVDSKASLLLSINAIIASVILGTLLPDLDQDPHLLVPTIMLLTSSLVSITYSVFAARPDRVVRARRAGSARGQESRLFFGSFQALERDEFQVQFQELMADRDQLYESLTDDIYFLGKELHRKYRFLRIAFNVFMVGFTVSVAAFVLCHIMFG